MSLKRPALYIGIGLVLTSWVSALSSGNYWFAVARAALGVILVGLWVAASYKTFTKGPARPPPVAGAAKTMSGASRASFFFLTTALISVFAVAAVSAVNFIVNKRNKTWDMTSKKIWSLAPQTTSALEGLKEPVKAVAFIGSTEPERDALDHFLRRYADVSDKFSYEMKEPDKNPDLVNKYQVRPGSPTIVLTRGEGDKESHSAVSLTALKRGGAEQELTNALIKLDRVGEQKVYFLTGHGEWPVDAQPGMLESDKASVASELKASLMQEGYAPETLSLAEKKNEVPRDAAAVIVAGARTPFASSEVEAVRTYLSQGGRLLYFADDRGEPGLDPVLAQHGIQVDPGLLADDQVAPEHPYVIFLATYAEHEATRLLRAMRINVEFRTARGLSVVNAGVLPGVTPTPLVLTFNTTWEESTPTANPTLTQGEKVGPVAAVMASERSVGEAPNKRFDSARLVVFGDSDILVDSAWGHEGNRNLVLNSLAWATQQTTRITIRPPDRDISSLDMNEETLLRIRFVAIDLVPSLLIGVGLTLWMVRRNR
jgi:ABC-type uncharacterized transport system involved in gliding motility auxiliary subunit